METKLVRINQIAKEKPKEVFTSLYHYLNEEMLSQCHQQLKANSAAGIDRITKETYTANLSENIHRLTESLKRHSYQPQPVKRVYIPKGKDRRPLGIPAYEDKIVQAGVTRILQAIYEADFLSFSYGFRPNKSGHKALKIKNGVRLHKFTK